MKKGKNNGLKWVLILLPLGIAGVIIMGQIKKANALKPGNLPPGTNPPVTTLPGNGGGCKFPLKKGSINDCVRQLQLALMAKYGASILPQFGADGNWGSETQGAVISATGQSQINSQADLNIILNNLSGTYGGVGGDAIGGLGGGLAGAAAGANSFYGN